MFEAQFAITIDGEVVDSRETGLISTETLTTELSTIQITGSTSTFSDTLIASSSIDIEASIEYESLAAIHTEAVVDIAVQAEMELSLELTMAAELGP